MRKRKESLLQKVESILSKGGFYVYVPTRIVDCLFDIIARKDNQLLLLIVRQQIDSVRTDAIFELRSLARAINGIPLIIVEKSDRSRIEDGVLYTRFDVPVFTVNTLRDYIIDGIPPFIFAAHGGLYVKMDGKEIQRIREEKGLTLGMVARVVGVSRKAIQQYEKGMGTFIDVALKVEEVLGKPVILPLDPFAIIPKKEYPPAKKISSYVEDECNVVQNLLGRLGFETMAAVRCPFDALGKIKNDTLLAGIEKPDPALQMKREISLAHVSRVAEARGVIFTRLMAKQRKSGIATISLGELKKTTEAEKLLAIIDERRGKPRVP